MLRAVVALTSADLLSHTSARSASLCTVDDVALGVSAATVVLVEVLRAHFEDCFPVESRKGVKEEGRCGFKVKAVEERLGSNGRVLLGQRVN